jgi:hypothetical protein
MSARQSTDESELIELVATLSIKQLKEVIDAGRVDRKSAVEKDDLRVLAVEAVAKGAPLPSSADEPVDVSASGKLSDPMPAEKQELATHWSYRALFVQCELLNVSVPPSASQSELVDAYWAHLVAAGLATGPEYDRRWLRVEALDKEAQALRFIEAVTGATLPEGASLQQALRSGERLCDMANVFLKAKGEKEISPTRSDGHESLEQAAESRLRAKHKDNLALYQGACLALGVSSGNTFNPDELYEGKNLPVVVKNVHALAQRAHTLVDYRGPQMGPVQRAERTWKQRASNVATDWRRTWLDLTPLDLTWRRAAGGVPWRALDPERPSALPSQLSARCWLLPLLTQRSLLLVCAGGNATGAGMKKAELLGKQIVKTGDHVLGTGGEMTFMGGGGARLAAHSRGEIRLGGVGRRVGAPPATESPEPTNRSSTGGAAPPPAAAEAAAPGGGKAAEEAVALEEVRSEPQWRDKYDYVDVAGQSEEAAGLTWVRAVLAKHELAPPPPGESLHAALGSGSALCRLLSTIAPGLVKEKLLDENPKKFEQMAAVEGYLNGCQKVSRAQAEPSRAKPSSVKLSSSRSKLSRAAALPCCHRAAATPLRRRSAATCMPCRMPPVPPCRHAASSAMPT